MRLNGYLVTSREEVSEVKRTFESVQEHMIALEKAGQVTNVKVEKFEDGLQIKEATYDYNGESWEKRD